jgi:hypothetical protein
MQAFYRCCGACGDAVNALSCVVHLSTGWPARDALDRQLPNLGEQCGQQRLARRRWAARASRTAGEQGRRALERGFLPGMDLARVDAKPARQFRYRSVLAKRSQRCLRLEVYTVFSYVRHRSPLAVWPC